jgi:sucrose-6-phosphate hydrolase SacC (GH32 family)
MARVSKYGEPATRAIYWTGTWADGLFKPFSRPPKNLDLVPGHLAPTVADAADGRPRAIGIIDERRTPAAQQRAGWAHTFSLPRVWFLMPDRMTLGQAPAPELAALRAKPRLAQAVMTLDEAPKVLASEPGPYELEIELDPDSSTGSVVVDVLVAPDDREQTRLIFDPVRQTVEVDKTRSTLAAEGEGPQRLTGSYEATAFGAMRTLRVIVDGSSIEAFVNDAAAHGVRSYPSLPTSTQIRLSASGKPLNAKVSLWPLQLPTTTRRQNP